MVAWLQRQLCPLTLLIHAKDQKIGDAFLQVPFFQSARARFPEARITLAVSLGKTVYASSLAPIIASYVDEIIEDAHLCDHWQQMLGGPRPLDGRKFDLVIDLQKTWWRTLAIHRIRHRWFISASKHYLFSSHRPRTPIKPPHLLDQHLKLLEAASDVERAVPIPVQWYGETERATARACLPDGVMAIGLVPGAGEAFKRWPLERFCEVGQAQVAKGRRAVFILGPQEAGWIDAITRAVPEALLPGWARPGPKKGGLNPLEVAALGERLSAVVTNDCGPAHILAVSSVPMVALFGGTNPVKYRPRTPMLQVVQSEVRGVTRWRRSRSSAYLVLWRRS